MERLYFQAMGSGSPLMILHGIFGSGDNWATIGKQLSTHFEVFLVDLRNHGRSPHDPVHTYGAMAADVLALQQSLNVGPMVLLGHSMGGKVAMEIALTTADALTKMVVVDIAPRVNRMDEQRLYLQLMRQLPLDELTTRQAIADYLQPHVPDEMVRLFLMKNLTRNPDGGFAWKINIDALSLAIDQIGQKPNALLPAATPTLFVKGERSGYIRVEDETEIKRLFPNATIVTVPKAGHWVHAENPEGLMAVLAPFLF